MQLKSQQKGLDSSGQVSQLQVQLCVRRYRKYDVEWTNNISLCAGLSGQQMCSPLYSVFTKVKIVLNTLKNLNFFIPLVGVEVGKPTHFTIYTKGAGKAKPKVCFTRAAKGEAVRDFEIIDNHDYSYTVRYTAVQQVRSYGSVFGLVGSAVQPAILSSPRSVSLRPQGITSVTVCHGGDPIPKSPFDISVAPPLDLSRVKVQGLNNSE